MGNRLWLTFSIVAPMLLAIFGSAHPQVVSPSTYGIKRTGYTSSSVCKSCHEAHYGYWTKTMHSKAYEDPIFQVAFLRAQVDEGEQVRAYCLSCHSPTTRVTKDFSTEKELSWEGVTCDFCHTITAVDLSREEFSYDLGITKRGPYKDAESPAHLTAYSPLFERSEFCGGCHEQRSRNGEGVLVLGTYTEWKESPYAAKEVHCQNCHMPKEPGVPIVKPDVKATDKILTAHEFMGGHSEIKLEKAAEVKTYIERDGDKATITTFVTNKESGHKLPTGTPARRVALVVTVRDSDGNTLAETRKVYRKVLVDENRVILEDMSDMLLKAVEIYSDNRIAPLETRKEKFQLDIPTNVREITVESILKYEFETPVMLTKMMAVEIASDIKNFAVATESRSRFIYYGVLILGVFAVGMLLSYWWFRRKKG